MASPDVYDFDYELSGLESTSYVPLDSYTEPSTGKLIVGANDYFALHPKESLWTGLSDTEKKQYLTRASVRLDQERFGGRKSNTNQRLQWPRLWIISRNYEEDFHVRFEFTGGDYYQSAKYLPKEIEEACFELALFYVEEWKEETELVSRREQERMESYTIGPLSVKMRKWKEEKLPDTVRRLLLAAGQNAWIGTRAPKLVRG